MNGMVNVVLYFPRYMMITGITVLGLAFCMPELRAIERSDEFERLLPMVLTRDVPQGVVGLLLAGLSGGVHVEFRGHDQRCPSLHRQ